MLRMAELEARKSFGVVSSAVSEPPHWPWLPISILGPGHERGKVVLLQLNTFLTNAVFCDKGGLWTNYVGAYRFSLSEIHKID